MRHLVGGLFVVAVCISVTSLAIAGIPDASTSTVTASGNGPCAPAAAVCPGGDSQTIDVEVVVRDTYGNPLAGEEVTVYPDPAATGFCFCSGYETATGTTDINGMVTVEFSKMGGCGDIAWYAEAQSVILGPSPEIFVASPDNNGDCQVNLSDFIVFASSYLTTFECFDIDGSCDMYVSLPDFVTFASHYLHTCPPAP
jgi:hypothetical protein